MTVSVLELRKGVGRILKALDRNEPVTLLYRGKPRAMIQPLPVQAGARRSVADHPVFGMWKDRKDMADVAAYVRRIRRGRFDGLR